ncbi:MAG: nucleoside deaminase [Candidatus Gastranaerophilaceae bacterium]
MTVTQLDRDRILEVHKKTAEIVKKGNGPFFASVYDEKGNIVAEAGNSVVKDQCPVYHAEVNAIRATCAKLGTYDLAPYNLSLYVNAEPCIMCVGAIMWSGIKHVYYGVPSKRVEEITGFDEGFKPNWHDEFANRGITVEGNIEVEEGEKVLQDYVNSGKEVYMPSR